MGVIITITGAKVQTFLEEQRLLDHLFAIITPFFDLHQKKSRKCVTSGFSRYINLISYNFGPAATSWMLVAFVPNLRVSDLQRQEPYRLRCPRTS